MYAIDMSRMELEVERGSSILLNQFKTVVTTKKVITIEMNSCKTIIYILKI